MTAAVCKTLYRDNVVLKTKHDALVSRVPHSYKSPVMSPIGSPLQENTGVLQSPLDPDPSAAGLGSPLPSAKRKRTRRISMTPAEFGQLSDQNSALLAQIETLEKDSDVSDQASKRKLQKLETEIQNLRKELENTREVLKEQEKVVKEIENEDVKKQRLEREERLQAIRHRTDSNASAMSYQDFAPSSSTTSTPKRVRPVKDSKPKPPIPDSDESGPIPFSYFTFPTRKGASQASEHSLLSQLLGKVRELEETNDEISAQQKAAAIKLRSAQLGAENMKRVYNYFSDEEDVDVEIVSDEGTHGQFPEDTMIKFSSLRRTISEDISKEHTRSRSSSPPRAHNKSRKSVVGFFDPSTSSSIEVDDIFSPTGDDNIDGDLALFPKIFSRHVSPAGSPLLAPSEAPNLGRSLGSELGSEFGDDWNADGGNHHLRSTSLYSLTQFVGDLSGLPPPPRERVQSLETNGGASDYGVQIRLNSPTPSEDDDSVPDLGSYRDRAYGRSRRLSHAVQSRTHRWVDGRFTPPRFPEKIKPRFTAPSNLLTKAFDTMMENIASKSPSPEAEAVEATDDDRPLDKPLEATALIATQGSDEEARPQRLPGFMLELWLWLQFIIIIMVFLYAMAKRGPKSVLQEAERKARSRA